VDIPKPMDMFNGILRDMKDYGTSSELPQVGNTLSLPLPESLCDATVFAVCL
jgi:hypothetical protein